MGETMKNIILFYVLGLVLIPGAAFAERPAITSLKKEIVNLVATVKLLENELNKTREELALTRNDLDFS